MTVPDCIDVSGNNGSIDWTKVHASGVHMAVSKCSEGTDSTYRSFPANWAGSRLLHRRGAYHFALADASAQANATAAVAAVNAAGGFTADDFLALDVEAPGQGKQWPLGAGRPSADWTLACLEEMERLTGRVPWLYCALGFLQGVLRADVRLARFPLWVADVNPIQAVPTPWPYALWQYSWTGRIPGIGNNVDCSRFGPAYHHSPTPQPEDDDMPSIEEIREVVKQVVEDAIGGASMTPPDPHATVVDVVKHYGSK